MFDKKSIPFTIGDTNERKVAVPDALYKIVIREKSAAEKTQSSDVEKNIPELLVFLYPQLGPRYYGSREDYEHERFLTSLREIETLTGLQFFFNADKLNLTNKALKQIRTKRANCLWPIEKPPDQPNIKIFVTGCSN